MEKKTGTYKIIQGIECHLIDAEDQCADCPYYDADGNYPECKKELLDDAFAALAEKLPRIMKLEEAKQCEYAYLETNDKRDPEPVKLMLRVASDPEHTMFGYFLEKHRGVTVQPYCMDELYNKTWRCWNVRPSEIKRKMTPWVKAPAWATVTENE
jgi:hypothetical protein